MLHEKVALGHVYKGRIGASQIATFRGPKAIARIKQ